MPLTSESVFDKLHNCYDPEIPLNVVDLGLIYGVTVENEGDVVGRDDVDGAGLSFAYGDQPRHPPDNAQHGRREHCKVNVVWDPPWTPERISPEGRQKLGIED